MSVTDSYTQSQTRLQSSVTELNVATAHWRRNAANAHLAATHGPPWRFRSDFVAVRGRRFCQSAQALIAQWPWPSAAWVPACSEVFRAGQAMCFDTTP